MARDIDAVIAFVREQKHISPIQQQVLVNRIEHEPTKAEIEHARNQVMGRLTAEVS